MKTGTRGEERGQGGRERKGERNAFVLAQASERVSE